MEEDLRITTGAEASVYRTVFLGRPAVRKVRSPKGYRVPELDSAIRSKRIRAEARLIRDARSAGIRTPVIYCVDPAEGSITMEYVQGVTAKRYLDENPDRALKVCRQIGHDLALLHNARISHGDLTTSNIIVMDGGRLCFIDFSMGSSQVGTEDMGVDIRLLERAFSSAHPALGREYPALIEEYCRYKTHPEQVMDKVREIGDRGRYT